MSQVQAQSGSAPGRARSALGRAKDAFAEFLRDFEWTWARAVTFSIALLLFLMGSAVILPSFWLYYAEQKLGWGGPTDLEGFINAPLGPEGFTQLRDAIAMGLTTGPIVTVLVVAAILQNWRKRLRGSGGETRPTGGYR
jgi:ABC-type Fe3+ transport system permease subunit